MVLNNSERMVAACMLRNHEIFAYAARTWTCAPTMKDFEALKEHLDKLYLDGKLGFSGGRMKSANNISDLWKDINTKEQRRKVGDMTAVAKFVLEAAGVQIIDVPQEKEPGLVSSIAKVRAAAIFDHFRWIWLFLHLDVLAVAKGEGPDTYRGQGEGVDHQPQLCQVQARARARLQRAQGDQREVQESQEEGQARREAERSPPHFFWFYHDTAQRAQKHFALRFLSSLSAKRPNYRRKKDARVKPGNFNPRFQFFNPIFF